MALPLEPVTPEEWLLPGGDLKAATLAAVGLKEAIEKAATICKKIRCKIEIHDAHHALGWPFNKRMNHVQLTCWIKGVKGSTFIIRIPFYVPTRRGGP